MQKNAIADRKQTSKSGLNNVLFGHPNTSMMSKFLSRLCFLKYPFGHLSGGIAQLTNKIEYMILSWRCDSDEAWNYQDVEGYGYCYLLRPN